MTVQEYIESISKRYGQGNSTEHTFRGDLQTLIESLVPAVRATNEPKRQACGAPDYILTIKDIPVGFIEAKDIGDKDLDGLKKNGNKGQFDRYKAALGNILFTDYINFHLYREGQFVSKIAIAKLSDKGIEALPENFAGFENMMKSFCAPIGQSIKSPQELAGFMADKARLLADVIEKSLASDETNQENSTLQDQMLAFKQILIHDITPKGFADVYAQTIAYGMFAARYHGAALPTFSRQEAYMLLPKSNPFLKKLFGYIAGLDVDDRIKWVVDDLVGIFLACDVSEILKNYGKSTQTEDPIIHFYEDFLGRYDPALRKARGVWYTPAPVVNFIVRAVDDVLKTDFGLPKGLADDGKAKIKSNQNGKESDREVHKVQILDPATGTGTFLSEVVKHIHRAFEGQQGAWGAYVENHLLPRLNGFELLMASYAMAHLKLDMLLTETGYKPAADHRLRVYLANSLEESHPDATTLFANWLSDEANEANRIKREVPVMCVIGNPPYSGESSNKGAWIAGLMEDYKKEPGGKEKLQERNPKWINDDYVKFLRYGQHFIEKNGSGVLAFINPHGFLDNPTFRGMRWNLLKTYDKIYVLDLHGNAKKKETAPGGEADENVFDIQQGVSINIFVKTGKKKNDELGKVFHFDLFGKRKDKYGFLASNSLKTVPYKEVPNIAPDYFFVGKDFSERAGYEDGFSLKDLFPLNGMGITSAHDEFVIGDNKAGLLKKFQDFQSSERDAKALLKKFGVKDKDGWDILKGYDAIKKHKNLSDFIEPIAYRPFDDRFVFYENNLVWRTVKKVMSHLAKGGNFGLAVGRQGQVVGAMPWNLTFVTQSISDINMFYRGGGTIFPLYLYPETKGEAEVSEYKKSLEAKLEESILLAEGFAKSFLKVKKMYDAFENPDTELKAYYKEQESIKEKLDSNVDKFKKQLALLFKQTIFEQESRKPNLNKEIVKEIADTLRLKFTDEKGTEPNTFAPIDMLDYIYAVLHSPAYRETYKEFLKIDFPKIPYPKNKETFWELARLGGEIRRLHLLESPVLENLITRYPKDGDNMVLKPRYNGGKVYINDAQYFENVPAAAWDFYIGGYQPAQKWLKDRKDRKLDFADILHYQKIILALSETDRLMGEIDAVWFE